MDKLPHIFLPSPPETRPYTSTLSPHIKKEIIPRNRREHGLFLKAQLKKAWEESLSCQLTSVSARNGVYLEFISDPNAELVTKSLEDMRSKEVRLLNIRKQENSLGQLVTFATVFVSNSKRKFFVNKLEEYISQNTKKGNPKHQDLVTSISDIKNALLVDSFWTDLKAPQPGSNKKWVEVWLRSDSDNDINIFDRLLTQLNLESRRGVVKFPERMVKVVFACSADLEKLTQTSDLIAEYRLAKSTAAFYMEMDAKEQKDWIDNLVERVDYQKNPVGSAVCILDTGVNKGHPLLQPFLSDEDCQTVEPAWGVHDHDRHGTLMAGTSLYGDLSPLLESQDIIQVPHILESVKILPNGGENEPDLWGYITAQGVNRAEIQAPMRKRSYCMAVTSTDTRDRGRPSSWSAEIDQLASQWNEQRLFIISGGNSLHGIEVQDAAKQYPDIQITESVHDPAQSWNALTVGAVTDLVAITDPNLSSYHPVADVHMLSPFSTTSSTWEENKWPIKPELVLEGGNLAIDNSGFVTECDDLSILSTSYMPHTQGYFYPFNMTSAATAQLARMAGILRAEYPSYWEETIRALLVHSADWPDALKNQFINGNSKGEFKRLLSICGYGIPDLNRALYSARNTLTLISQAELQPFDKESGRIRTKDMHFYDLPWPIEVLQALPDDVDVKMKITLSYFIEPGPGEIGWKDRYRYASHVLRFDINNPGESKEEFIKRINKAAREEDEQLSSTQSASGHWLLGSNARDRGSVHSDTWNGTSAELASSRFISIMPKIGWWKERSHLGDWGRKTRYSLIVSIETEETEIDLYTPIVTKLQIPIEVPV